MGRVKIFSPAAEAQELFKIVRCVIEPLEYSHRQGTAVYFKVPYSLIAEKKAVTVCIVTAGDSTSTYYQNQVKSSFVFAGLWISNNNVVVQQTSYNSTPWGVYTAMYEDNGNRTYANASMTNAGAVFYDKTTELLYMGRQDTTGDNGKESSAAFIFYRE